MSRAGLTNRVARRGFTIVEVLVVMTIILILAGLILATSSYVHNKGARSRAEAEIAAMSAALENYKVDNGIYPAATSAAPQTDSDPTATGYKSASLILYENLSGDFNVDRQGDPGTKSYFSFKNNQLNPTSGNVQYVQDPFGNSYGYSTIGETDTSKGYNPTFDLWSTSGSTAVSGRTAWVKNW